MLFNSFEFILVFLPVALGVYFFLNSRRLTVASRAWLVFASFFFYGWWNVAYLPILLGSVLFNFAFGSGLSSGLASVSASGSGGGGPAKRRKAVLVLGIVANLSLIGYFKYYNFFIINAGSVFPMGLELHNLVLPLGISFFTFQQITYLVDSYYGKTHEYDFLNYALFVSFFPQLIAGPIVHHSEMMPQFARVRNKVFHYDNVAKGMLIFSIGLAKKVLIADNLSAYVHACFDVADTLVFDQAWAASLAYTLQLYYDFSGYSDMAIGAGLLFNIRIPVNFYSPHKALNIRDFWRRWHITLGRFLMDYIYIPLGGSRLGKFRTYYNLLATFFIAGLWHGAGWLFIIWGSMHGLALVVHRLWESAGLRMPKVLAWALTFLFVDVMLVVFRATTPEDALMVLKGMAGLNGFEADFYVIKLSNWEERFLGVAFLMLFAKNSIQLKEGLKPNWLMCVYVIVLLGASLMGMTSVSEFLYFNF